MFNICLQTYKSYSFTVEFSNIWPLKILTTAVTNLSVSLSSGICSGSTLGILIFSILKVAITKERPSGGTKGTKQPYKLNRTLLVAISLPWVVNHSVCHREVYVVCAQSATTSKLWERAEIGGQGGFCTLSATHGQPQRIQPITSSTGILFA